MAFVDQAALAEDPVFRDRVMMATVTAAVQIAAEAPSGNDEVDQARAYLATQVMNHPEGYAERFSYCVAQNPAITAESTDSDIQFTVNAVWNGMAGL